MSAYSKYGYLNDQFTISVIIFKWHKVAYK